MQSVSPTRNSIIVPTIECRTTESKNRNNDHVDLNLSAGYPKHLNAVDSSDRGEWSNEVQVQRVANGKFLEMEQEMAPILESDDEIKPHINRAYNSLKKKRLTSEVGLESTQPWKRSNRETYDGTASISRAIFMLHCFGAFGYEFLRLRNTLELMKMAEVNTVTKRHIQRYFVDEAIRLTRSCSEQGCCSEILLQELKDVVDRLDEANPNDNQQLRGEQENRIFNKYLQLVNELNLINRATGELYGLILNFAKRAAQIGGTTIAAAMDSFYNGVPLSEYMEVLDNNRNRRSEYFLSLGIDRESWIGDCREVLLELVENGKSIPFFSPRLSSDREFIKDIVLQRPYHIRYASDDILEDLDFVISLAKEVKRNDPAKLHDFLGGIPHIDLRDSIAEIRKDPDTLLLLAQKIKEDGGDASKLISMADLILRGDKCFMLEAIRIDPYSIASVSGNLRTLIQQPIFGRDINGNPCITGYKLCSAPVRDMWLAALLKEGDLWDTELSCMVDDQVKEEISQEYLSTCDFSGGRITVLPVSQIPEYRLDEEMAIAALNSLLNKCECCEDVDRALCLWRRFPPELQGNHKIILALAKRDARVLPLFNNELRADKEFIFELAKSNPLAAMEYAYADLKADREFILELMNYYDLALEYANDELKADKKFVLEVVKRSGLALEYASDALKADKEVVLAAVQKCGWALEYASDALRADRDVVFAAVRQCGGTLECANPSLKEDKDVVIAAVYEDCEVWEYLSDTMRADKEVFFTAFQQYVESLQYASDELRANKEIVLMAVQKDWAAFEYAHEDLRHDKPFIMELISLGLDFRFLRYVGDDLKNDPEFMLSAVQKNGNCLMIASDALRENAQIVWAAVQQNAVALNFAGDRFKDDERLVLKVVSQDGAAFKYASDRLRDSEEVALTAVANNGMALRYASEQLQDSTRWLEIVLTAVQQNGNALAFAGPALKSDRQIVLAAVKQDGRALWCASDELRKDPYIVMSAVKQNGKALQFASNELKDNPYLVSIAIKQNEEALQFASRRLKASPNIISAAGRLQESDRLVCLEKELTWLLSPGVIFINPPAVCREALQDLSVIQQHSSHELSTHPILDRRVYKLLRQLQSSLHERECDSLIQSFFNNDEIASPFSSYLDDDVDNII